MRRGHSTAMVLVHTPSGRPEFSSWSFDEVGFGVAFAVRVR